MCINTVPIHAGTFTHATTHLYPMVYMYMPMYLPRANGSGPPCSVVAFQLRVGGDFGVGRRLRLGELENAKNGWTVDITIVSGA
jgi:hypothetical protein